MFSLIQQGNTGIQKILIANITHNQTFIALSLQEMLHFARDKSPGKMQKALAIGRLPGAESPANLLIANEYIRALAPGKCAPGTAPGSTPGKLCLCECRLFWSMQAFADCVSITSVLFKTCQGLCEGLTPGKLRTIFFLIFFLLKKSKY